MLSGVPLNLGNAGSARYPTLEHIAPGSGQGGWLVVAAAINDMKSDFDVDEFCNAVPLLAKALRGRDLKASTDLCSLLDGLRHFRRIKAIEAVETAVAQADAVQAVVLPQ